MKPKEKIMKWLILMFAVANYTQCEYIADSGPLTLNNKLDEKHEFDSKYGKTEEHKSIGIQENIRLSKRSRYEHRDENSSASKTKDSRRILSYIIGSGRNNIDRQRTRVTREIREVYIEIPRLNIRKVSSLRSANVERNLRRMDSNQKGLFKLRSVRTNGQTTEIRDIKSNLRQQSRKNYLNRFYSARRNYLSNSKTYNEDTVSDQSYSKPVNGFRTVKQNFISENSKRQVYMKQRKNVEQNRQRRFIREEKSKGSNDRQISRNRRERIREYTHTRDNTMRFASEERSSLSNRLIPKSLSKVFTENQRSIQNTLTRGKRNILRQVDQRIQSTREIHDLGSSRSRKVSRNNDKTSSDQRRTGLTRDRININIISPKIPKNKEERIRSNDAENPKNRREKSEDRFTQKENFRRQNNRQEMNRNRHDRIQTFIQVRDKTMRLASKERSFSNRFILNFYSEAFKENKAAIQKTFEMTGNKKISLNREKRTTTRQTEKRIQNTRDIVSGENSFRNRTVNNNSERSIENRRRNIVRREHDTLNIGPRQYSKQKKEERAGTNELEIRENRRQRSENRKHQRYGIQLPQRRQIHNSFDRKLTKSSRSTRYFNEENQILNSLPRSINRNSKERQLFLAKRNAFESNLNRRRIETLKNENKRYDLLKEINVHKFSENSERNVPEKKHVHSYEISLDVKTIRSIPEPKMSRLLKREVTRRQEDFSRKIKLNNNVAVRTKQNVIPLSLNDQHKIRQDQERVSERRKTKSRISPEINDNSHTRFIRDSSRETASRRKNTEIKNRLRKIQVQERLPSSSVNIQLKFQADSARGRHLPKDRYRQEGGKGLTERNRRQERYIQSGFVADDGIEFIYYRNSINERSRVVRLESLKTSKSRLQGRKYIYRQTRSAEIQLVRSNENSKRFVNFIDKREYDRSATKNKEQIIKRITEESSVPEHRSIRERSNRNIYRLHAKNTRLSKNIESHQREIKSNYRNSIRQVTLHGIRKIEVMREHPRGYRILENMFYRTSNKIFYEEFQKDPLEPTKTYKLVKTERNGRNLQERNLNRFFGERMKTITNRNVRARRTNEILERKTQNIVRLLPEVSKRKNDITSRAKKDLMISNSIERQSVHKNVISNEGLDKLLLKRIDKLRKQPRKLRNDRRFFDKVNLDQNPIARNLIQNNREEMNANKRNGRRFRGRTSNVDRIVTLSRRNAQLYAVNRRIIFNTENLQNFQPKSIPRENRNDNLLRQRNGRGYRGKFDERIAEQRALVYNAKENNFIFFITPRSLYQLMTSSKYYKPSNIVEGSVSILEDRRIVRRVDRIRSFDNARRNIGNTFTTTAISTERGKFSQRNAISSTPNSHQLTSSVTRLTRDSNKHTAKEPITLNNRERTDERFDRRLNRRLNAFTRSRNDIRNNFFKLNHKARQNIYFDILIRNVHLSSDLSIRKKYAKSRDVEPIYSFPLSHQNRRQISRSSLDVIRHSRAKEEPRKERTRIVLNDGIRTITKREDHKSLSTLNTENDEIQKHSALVSSSTNNNLEKRQSSQIREIEKSQSNILATGSWEFWKMREINGTSFIVNLILGLLIILATSERNGIKTKPFKEKLTDILFLRATVV